MIHEKMEVIYSISDEISRCEKLYKELLDLTIDKCNVDLMLIEQMYVDVDLKPTVEEFILMCDRRIKEIETELEKYFEKYVRQ